MTNNAGHLLGKDELMTLLWPRVVVVEDSLVQCVVELRRALGDSDRRIVRTVAGRGYRFDPPAADSSLANVRRHDEFNMLTPSWTALTSAPDAAAVRKARMAFEQVASEKELRAEAFTGIAMAYVIEVLNRWSSTSAWDAALAREAAAEAVSIAPDSPGSLHARAHVALIDGEHVSAYLGFRAALARDPAMVRARLRMGVIEMELGRPERTELHVKAALTNSEPDGSVYAQACFVQGMAYFHLGCDELARASMQTVLTIQPKMGLAHQWIAAIDAIHGRVESGEHHIRAFQELVPGHTIESLIATERSRVPSFVERRARLYDGLRCAGYR